MSMFAIYPIRLLPKGFETDNYEINGQRIHVMPNINTVPKRNLTSSLVKDKARVIKDVEEFLANGGTITEIARIKPDKFYSDNPPIPAYKHVK